MRVEFGSSRTRCRQRVLRYFRQKLDRGMKPSDFEISGTPSDWVIQTFRVDGMTRFLQSGGIPGDMFTMKPAIYSFVAFAKIPAGATVTIAVQFVGDAPAAPFVCALAGRAEAESTR